MSVKLTTATVNLLSPTGHFKKPAHQKDRIPEILEALKHPRPGDSRIAERKLDILTITELEDPEDIHIFCEELGMTLVRLCTQTDTPNESNAVLVSSELASEVHGVQGQYIGSDRRHRQALFARLGNTQLVGVHQPWEIRAERGRYQGSNFIIQKCRLSDRSIVMGDFNTVWFAPSRLLYLAHGYEAASSYTHDNKFFPAPGYKTVSIPPVARGFYKIGLDDTYVSDGILVVDAWGRYTATDHPILFSRISMNSL